MAQAAPTSPGVLKLSAPDAGGYWEIPILFLDDFLLAVDKPAGLLTSPDRYDPSRPNLMRLLHEHIRRGVAWSRAGGFNYLANAHRLDCETSGVLLLARTKPVLTALGDQFSSGKPGKRYLALVHGAPPGDAFSVDAPLAPHPHRPGVILVHRRDGKRSRTDFRVLSRFLGFTYLECQPHTGRTHQIRVHLQEVGCSIVGDRTYGGNPLRLSELKRDYCKPRGRPERPLLDRVALHAAALTILHPVAGAPLEIESPLPRDMAVALKYLNRFATARL